jgi:preprotein translocase subunit SecD
MLHFPRWKVWGITLICLLCVLLAVPSVLPPSVGQNLPAWVNGTRINLGLDLAGGSHLLLEAEVAEVSVQRLEAMEELMRREMRTARIDITQVSTSGGQLSFVVENPAQVAQAAEAARGQSQGGTAFAATQDWDVAVDGNRVTMRQTAGGVDRAIAQAMGVAREIIDRRINALGTLEPTIIRQGTSRIVVQVPGMQDPEALKRLIGRTARLEFKLVDTSVTAEQLQSGRAPPGSQILPYAEGGEGARIAVQRRAMISGEQIADARQDFNENGQPAVTISFDGAGSRRFARVTQENVGKPFAIILDNVVISAPNIREPILGGSASVAGSFTVESANQLAISLRSGRLPVELHVIEERTVGPDLGADSIRLGIIASIGATLLVILFMLITYGRFGVYATVALVLNALMILGIMAFFNATLTLPGIAGFVLTIGAAVDANVLINERIREEQRRGRKLHDALEAGYREASTAIFDANITNVIAAVLMFYFGSGPIRGFAVVLMIGIITSVFTAVNVTRMLVALWVRRARPKELQI